MDTPCLPREITFYEALEVSPRASASVIRAAYRCLVQVNHPDKHLGSEDASATLVRLNHAYAVLSDPFKRMSYDRAMAAQAGVMDRRGKEADSSQGAEAAVHFGSRAFAFRPLG